jgi:hypothetical protein
MHRQRLFLCVSVCDISELEVLLNSVSALNADKLNPICKEKEKLDDNETIRRKKTIRTNVKNLKLIKL